jgi:hypothetical protein
MKKALLLGLVLGFAGVVAGASLYPWADAPRLPSRTAVVANGGRAESFIVRLPADRIAGFGSPGVGLRAPGSAAGKLPPPWTAQPVLLEQFKLRDTAGNVVGLAARHWTTTPQGNGVAWALMIPARGTLMLSGQGEAEGAVDAALRERGYVPGSDWHGDVTVPLSASGAQSPLAAGSEEFAGLAIGYQETWSVTGVSADGQLRGTIRIDTTSRQAP